jgi:starch phosphorylase
MSNPDLSSLVPALDLSARTVAYFSMEIALDPSLPTYSGGLGVLAGDTLRSAADTAADIVAVSLVHRRGYFRQHLDALGQQTESDVPWSPETTLPSSGETISLTMQGREVRICAWRFDVVGTAGHIIPVFLLDSDVEGNEAWDRHLTDHLYGGDTHYRLCQETILGLGGLKILDALGCRPEVYHMNEGHASLLAIGLLEQQAGDAGLPGATDAEADVVRQQCVFTTHTPVPAGHDQFGLDQMYQVLGHERAEAIERFGCLHNNLMNMTYIALRFSRFVNGVAMQHGKVSKVMFPDYKISAITNGVHAATWLSTPMQLLLDREVPAWRHDNSYFRSVYGIVPEEIAACHRLTKQHLFEVVAERSAEREKEQGNITEEAKRTPTFDPAILTLGFARRVATYKRASLLFTDPERLVKIADSIGGLQILFAGKAHPADLAGKELIRGVFEQAAHLNSASLKIVYLENYDWDLGALLTQGVDVWVNTPRRPYEASGTSGMKAALNGVPSLSVLDGWWIEGCAEGITGWAIEDGDTEAAEAASLYDKLEHAIAPLFAQPAAWAKMQQHCVAINGSFFNTHRMLHQYVTNAYFPQIPPPSVPSRAERLAEITALA